MIFLITSVPITGKNSTPFNTFALYEVLDDMDVIAGMADELLRLLAKAHKVKK